MNLIYKAYNTKNINTVLSLLNTSIRIQIFAFMINSVFDNFHASVGVLYAVCIHIMTSAETYIILKTKPKWRNKKCKSEGFGSCFLRNKSVSKMARSQKLISSADHAHM